MTRPFRQFWHPLPRFPLRWPSKEQMREYARARRAEAAAKAKTAQANGTTGKRRECGFGGQSAVAAAIRNATRKSGPYTARLYNDVARIRATFHSPEYRLFAHRSSPICSQ
jgi:hypothetical protein